MFIDTIIVAAVVIALFLISATPGMVATAADLEPGSRMIATFFCLA